MAEYSDIINQVDSSLATFDSASLKAQKRLMEQVMALSKDLDTDPHGNIKTTISNLQKIAKIKATISKIVCDDKYKDSVTKLCENFEKVYQKQSQYYKKNFQEGTLSETASKKQKLLRQIAVDNTIEGLTGAGIQQQITDKLTDMLTKSVTSGAKWTDMVGEMKAYLDPDGDGTGAFAKYAKTYATTAMGQFTGQNNKLMTDALDTEWYMYVGSDIETTREFCQHLTHKKYIHVSEIPTILKGDIDGHQCKIYEKTGLPQGMIEGTTPENFQVNVGGWNCRHQLLPIAEQAVPQNIRDKFENRQEDQKISDFDRFMQDYYDRMDLLANKADICGMSFIVNDITNSKDLSYEEYVSIFERVKSGVEKFYNITKKTFEDRIDSINNIINIAKSKGVHDVESEAKSFIAQNKWDTITDRNHYIEFMRSSSQKITDWNVRINSYNPSNTSSGTQSSGINVNGITDPVKAIMDAISANNVTKKDVADYKTQPDEKEIIERLGGRDRTKGSCSSLAFAYAGNKCGFDVLDFRGGSSLSVFCRNGNIRLMCLSAGGKEARSVSDFDSANQLLSTMVDGKEYYFACAQHASIVRKTNGTIEYLELQDDNSRNGYHKLDKDTLRWRFGAKRSHTFYGMKHEIPSFLIPVENLGKLKEFKDILGYINTNEADQQKGSGGGIK